jgi:hypothetical protein
MGEFYISPGTRAQYAPTGGMMNVSMDFNAAPSGSARGTEVIIPDNASPEIRAAAEQYNAGVAAFALQNGIADYPVRGVRTRSENGRGVANTIHAEPFFNSDSDMQMAIRNNPAGFAEIYRTAFGALPNTRLIAPHGVGADRGAASDYFTDETSFGELMANSLLGNPYELAAMASGPQATISTRNVQTPNTNNAPTGGILSNEGNQMDRQPQGLLGSMGIQRRDPNAQGETSQPFYNRQSFGDTLARIAPALGRMGVMGLEGPAQAALDSRNERQGNERAQQAQAGRVNQTIEWMRSQPNGEQFAAMAEQVGIEPAMQAMQAANAPVDQTSGMQNYDFLLAQGMDPASAMERAFGAGGTSVNVNTGPSETAFSQETGKIIAQEADSVAQQGAAAQRSLGQLNTLEQALLNSPAGAGGAIANMAANIGIKTEGVENLELANAIISQLVPSQRPPGSGVMSDADLALFKASLPRLINTREGNQLIIDTMRNIAQYDMQRGEIARGMQLGQITPDVAFTRYGALGNPLSAFQNQGGGGATPPPAGGGADFSGMSDAELQAIAGGGQ